MHNNTSPSLTKMSKCLTREQSLDSLACINELVLVFCSECYHFNIKALKQVDVSSCRDGKYICQGRDVADMLMKRAFSRQLRMSNCEPENCGVVFSFISGVPSRSSNIAELVCQP